MAQVPELVYHPSVMATISVARAGGPPIRNGYPFVLMDELRYHKIEQTLRFALEIDMKSVCFQMGAGFRNSGELRSLPTKGLGANSAA